MDNQNQNTNVIFPTGDPGTTGGSVGYGQKLSQPQSLDPVAPAPIQPIAVAQQQKEQRLLVRLVKRADVILAILLVLGSAGLVLNAYVGDEPAAKSVTSEYDTTQIPLEEFVTSEGIDFGTQSVIINGHLQANNGLIIAPTLQPTSAVAGQMYYDQTSNVLSYYNGTQFVAVGSGVQNLGGLTGQIGLGGGLSSAGGQLSNTGVLSVQGLTGNVTLNAGSGIGIAGNTISNTGIISVTSSSPTLTVTNDGSGNITLGGSGAGTVSSPGGTSGKIPVFTGAQTIEDSIVTQSGLTVTVSGDLAVVTGGLTLSNALTVSNGGTGATSLALNGVLVGQGTGAITSVTAGGAGLCLLSTAGAPSWSACPGAGGVTSLNSLTGALSIANASGAGSTITIDDASTIAKGIAQFNATNFSVGSGVVNTVQNINTGASPTFAGVNTNNITPSGTLTVGSTSQALTLQGSGGTTLTATNLANTTTVGFVAPSANVAINFPALSAGTYDICTTSGNCLGGGGGGANTALSNLTGVAINTTLLPGSAGGVHLGSATLPFGDVFLAGTSVTPGTNNFRITGASTAGTRTITIPDATGTVCLTTGNCAGSGGGVTTSGGTVGTLPVFTGSQVIGDSLVSQSGGVVTVNGHLNLIAGNQYRIGGVQISSANLSNDANLAKLNASQTFTGSTNAFQNGANSTNAFNVQNAAGTRLLTIDTTNGEVELGTASALNGTLVFNNVSNTNTVTIVPGTPSANRTITLPNDSGIVCLDSGNCAGAGATLQTAYNFSVGGTTPKIKVNSTLGGVDVQDADTTINANLLNIRASNSLGLGSVMFGVHSAGAVTLQNASNSTTALRVLTSGGTSVLTVDTTNGQTLLGQSGTLAGNLVFRNATNTNTGTLTTAALGQNTIYTLPDPVAGSATICLTSGNCLGGSGGANASLSNLSSVAINTTLLPGAAGTIHLGSGTLPFGDLFLAGSSATPGTNNFRVTGTSTGGTRTITLPDASGTVCLQSSTSCGFASSSTAFVQGGNSFTAIAVLGTNDAFDLQLERGGVTQMTVGSGNITLATNVDLLLQGASAFISNPQAQTASEAFGLNATVSGANAVALGNGATAAADAIAIGQGATTTGGGVAIGQLAAASGTFGGPVAIGDGAIAASWGVAIGSGSSTSGNWGTAVGNGATVTNQTGTAIGESSVASMGSVAVGSEASASGFNQIAIGYSAATTADNQLVIGGSTADGSYITNAFIGSGVTDVTPQNVTIQGTGGSGANVAGASVNLAAGRSTGSANGGNLNVQISAPGIAGSSLNPLATVASFSGANGAATFQNASNSTNAFRILNAAGTGEHVGVDTTDSILRLLANNTGHLSGTGTNWNTGTALPAARGSGAAVTVNGYLYHLGGCDAGSGATTTVYYARLNSDGSVGSWSTTTVLPQALCGNSATTYNGYIYTHGGGSSAAISQDVFYAKPNSDGTISSWTTQDNPTNLLDHNNAGMAAHNGYLYVAGGNQNSSTTLRHVFYGRINSDGSVPSFTQQTDWLPIGDHNPGQVAIANGTLYVMGSSNFDKFFYGRINADGSVVAQTQATGTTASRKYAAISVLNGYMYAIAGGTSGLSSVQYGAFANSGDIGAFTTDTTTLPALRSVCAHTAPTANNYIYLVGCGDGSFTAQATVYYASGTRVKVGGGLDLVGYSGEGASDGGTGGQLSAGNTSINGSLSVTGNTNLKDGVVIGNNLTLTGLASLQTTTNSTTGFQVLNASGTSQFTIDSTNSRVYIGNPTSDTTGALLVLDTKSSSGDPTGVAGGMYYNSARGSLRCFEDSMWWSCRDTSHSSARYRTDQWKFGSEGPFLAYVFEGDGGHSALTGIANHPGVTSHSTGTTLTGSVGIGIDDSGDDWLLLGNGDTWRYETVLRVPTLSDGTQTFTVRAGFMDSGGAESTDGCYFRYSNGINSGRWQGICADAGSSTCDTGITVGANTWYRLTVVVNSTGTSADFLTDGVSRCQVTTQIPDTAGNETGANQHITKSAGTTPMTFQTDYIDIYGDTTGR